MRLSPERIKELQKLLKEQTGKDYTDEEAQQAGLSIMRFVVAKEQRNREASEPRILDLSQATPTEKKIVELLKEFDQDGTPFSLHIHNPKEPTQYFDLKFDDYDKLRLLRYVLHDFTGLRVFDTPYEKVNWEVPFYYQGKQCTVMHQKFGFKLLLEHGLSKQETKQLHDDIVMKLSKALNLVQKVVRQGAADALQSGNIIISNKLREARGMYEFFKSQAQEVQPEDHYDLEALRESKKSLEEFLEDMRKISTSKQKADYLEQAAYLSYFGMLEHLCVLFLPFSKSSHASDPHNFIRKLNWSQKFKEVFPITDPDFRQLYDYLHELADHRRNATAHGYFDKLNTNYSFYFEPAKHRIPFSVYDGKIVEKWQDKALNFKKLDSLLPLLAANPKTKNAYKYITGEFDISFAQKDVKQYRRLQKMSEEDADEYIKHESEVRDAYANMDFGMI